MPKLFVRHALPALLGVLLAAAPGARGADAPATAAVPAACPIMAQAA